MQFAARKGCKRAKGGIFNICNQLWDRGLWTKGVVFSTFCNLLWDRDVQKGIGDKFNFLQCCKAGKLLTLFSLTGDIFSCYKKTLVLWSRHFLLCIQLPFFLKVEFFSDLNFWEQRFIYFWTKSHWWVWGSIGFRVYQNIYHWSS